jgi:CRISPR-associated protein Cas5t
LLSLVGEQDRTRHEKVRIAPGVIGKPAKSVVLRTVWRVKSKPLGAPGNTRPDYQQLLAGVHLVIWLDSSNENSATNTLESRVLTALSPETRGQIERFGGLSLGESTHLVDEVSLLERTHQLDMAMNVDLFVVHPRGRITLPVWVDHVGSSGTRYSTGSLESRKLGLAPSIEELSLISAN